MVLSMTEESTVCKHCPTVDIFLCENNVHLYKEKFHLFRLLLYCMHVKCIFFSYLFTCLLVNVMFFQLLPNTDYLQQNEDYVRAK